MNYDIAAGPSLIVSDVSISNIEEEKNGQLTRANNIQTVQD